jgi:hypothetical protein
MILGDPHVVPLTMYDNVLYHTYMANPAPERRFDFATPEEARGFIAGVREGARFMGDDDPIKRLIAAELVPPAEPWSHGETGKWVVVVSKRS